MGEASAVRTAWWTWPMLAAAKGTRVKEEKWVDDQVGPRDVRMTCCKKDEQRRRRERESGYLHLPIWHVVRCVLDAPEYGFELWREDVGVCMWIGVESSAYVLQNEWTLDTHKLAQL